MAGAVGLSVRLLSAVEAGRALPDRDVVLRLTEHLAVPLRARNTLLVAAGYESVFPACFLGDPAPADIGITIEGMMTGHAPFPALALDRHWNLVACNDALRLLISGADPSLLSAPVNWARLTLHPAGLAPRIANLGHWRAIVLNRLTRRSEIDGDAVLANLRKEIAAYPAPPPPAAAEPRSPVAEPLCLETIEGLLTFTIATTTFESAVDVTLAELSVETFHPADSDTAAIMRRYAAAPPATGGSPAPEP